MSVLYCKSCRKDVTKIGGDKCPFCKGDLKNITEEELDLNERMVEKLSNLKKENNVDWSKYSASFGHAELKLGYYYNVLHFHRDIRGDEGDDGGYTVSISEKDGKYYLHVLYISLNNGECDWWVVDEDDEDELPDFLTFNSVEECQDYINFLVENLKDLDEYEGDWEEYEDLKGSARIQAFFLQNMHFPFSEYPEIEERDLRSLSKTKYIPNFWSWEDDNE